jgi:5-methylthioadenosine/S-adenosylhomocysteine deaminase
MAKAPIDPLSGPQYILNGKIVMMDAGFTVISSGNVFIEKGEIKYVQEKKAPFPAEFKNAPLIRTGGTLYPGLIELHNHLSYNILPLWDVPRKFENRDQWGNIPDYRKLISGPMQVMGKTPGFVEAIVRYVEAKCLLGGTTTSQGIALFSNNGIQKYYRGIIRNAEQTDEPDLPEALSKISDVEAQDAVKFLARLKSASCLLLHLSEGVDDRAHKHFEALKLPDGSFALWKSLAGIHSTALTAADFSIMKQHGASIIWSPLSNLLLYGDTTKVKEAKQNGVLIGLGSDWSPTGSKNVFSEVKIAKIFSDHHGGIFTDRELLELVTTNPARILGWDQHIGSLEVGKRADILVLKGVKGDPYKRFLNSTEKDIGLVVINGIPRYGHVGLMKPFGAGSEQWKIGTARRILNLDQETLDPTVGDLTLFEAMNRLKDGLQRLPELAKALEQKPLRMMSPATASTSWFLVLDHNETDGSSQRPLLAPGDKERFSAPAPLLRAAGPISEIVKPVALDPLTVVDDKDFYAKLASQPNLPGYIKTGLNNLQK